MENIQGSYIYLFFKSHLNCIKTLNVVLEIMFYTHCVKLNSTNFSCNYLLDVRYLFSFNAKWFLVSQYGKIHEPEVGMNI